VTNESKKASKVFPILLLSLALFVGIFNINSTYAAPDLTIQMGPGVNSTVNAPIFDNVVLRLGETGRKTVSVHNVGNFQSRLTVVSNRHNVVQANHPVWRHVFLNGHRISTLSTQDVVLFGNIIIAPRSSINLNFDYWMNLPSPSNDFFTDFTITFRLEQDGPDLTPTPITPPEVETPPYTPEPTPEPTPTPYPTEEENEETTVTPTPSPSPSPTPTPSPTVTPPHPDTNEDDEEETTVIETEENDDDSLDALMPIWPPIVDENLIDDLDNLPDTSAANENEADDNNDDGRTWVYHPDTGEFVPEFLVREEEQNIFEYIGSAILGTVLSIVDNPGEILTYLSTFTRNVSREIVASVNYTFRNIQTQFIEHPVRSVSITFVLTIMFAYVVLMFLATLRRRERCGWVDEDDNNHQCENKINRKLGEVKKMVILNPEDDKKQKVMLCDDHLRSMVSDEDYDDLQSQTTVVEQVRIFIENKLAALLKFAKKTKEEVITDDFPEPSES